MYTFIIDMCIYIQELLALCCQYIRMSFVPFYAKYAIFIASNRAINNKPLSISFRYGLLLSFSLSLSFALMPNIANSLPALFYRIDACTCRRFHLLLAPSQIYVQCTFIQLQMNTISYRVKLVALIIS